MIGIAVLGIAIASLIASTKSKPEKLVEEFYEFEQDGDFGSSWDLFHSQMKQRFNKDQYIQSRAHIFMQDLQAKSFTFELGKSNDLQEWKGMDGAPTLKNVQEISVIQTYYGKFGKFVIEQPCYVVKEKGEWRLLWDYNIE